MFNYTPEWSDAAVRRFIARVGIDSLDDLFALRAADRFGMKNKTADSPLLFEFRKRINTILENEKAFSIKDLDIDGSILQRELKLKAGPVIGTILHELFESVLDDPDLNTRKKLLEIADNFLKQHLGHR
ncbi:MAG: hypothetical protein DRP59_11655 [Spirochaetes bacterium]|nr:MAG: hypothetical protein DRP59_11655 [Spirochaetota bacterium]